MSHVLCVGQVGGVKYSPRSSIARSKNSKRNGRTKTAGSEVFGKIRSFSSPLNHGYLDLACSVKVRLIAVNGKLKSEDITVVR